jgi:hypothetical protein
MDLRRERVFLRGALIDWWKIETECVYCAVGTASLNKTQINFRPKWINKI